MPKFSTPLEALRYHVTGAIERGEKKPIVNISPSDLQVLRNKLEIAIAQWDKKQRNPNAGGIALLRLDETIDEIAKGTSVARALYDAFNDRLLTALEKAAGVKVTYGGGAHDSGRPD